MQRRFDVDNVSLEGALLAIFGTHGARAAAISTAPFSSTGIALTTTKLISAAGIAAVGLCAFLYCDGTQSGDRPPLVAEASASDAQRASATIDKRDAGSM